MLMAAASAVWHWLKVTGVNNYKNVDWIIYGCFGFKVLVALVSDYRQAVRTSWKNLFWKLYFLFLNFCNQMSYTALHLRLFQGKMIFTTWCTNRRKRRTFVSWLTACLSFNAIFNELITLVLKTGQCLSWAASHPQTMFLTFILH